MQRWCNKLRSITTTTTTKTPFIESTIKTMPFYQIPNNTRLLHFSSINHHIPNTNFINPLFFNHPVNGRSLPWLINFNLSFPSPHPSSFTQLRSLTKKEMKEKMLKYKPRTPTTSKLKKYKIKCYSSFKGRFKLLKDGTIRRWKEGKRHNAHLKSKSAKRRGRRPGLVPVAYAKVMKKLNFCG